MLPWRNGKDGIARQKTNRRYTYADLMEWPESERWELYHGQAWAMSSLTDAHQFILGYLFAELHAYLKGKPCKVILLPFDVLLPQEPLEPEDFRQVDTVIQPELIVTCDRTKISKHGHWGAPDLAIEIISSSAMSATSRAALSARKPCSTTATHPIRRCLLSPARSPRYTAAIPTRRPT